VAVEAFVIDSAEVAEAGWANAGEWDEFVARAPGGDLVQTTAWAESKRALGFEVLAAPVRAGTALVGGAQIVVKRLGPLGALAYVARGPLLACGCGHHAREVVDAVEDAARRARVRLIVVQPPPGCDAIEAELVARGYTLDAPAVSPSATMRIDLRPSLEQILARMAPSKRHEIRRGQRAGVTIKSGARTDIELFHDLHQATARRQGFPALSKSYLVQQWDALPRGAIRLILAYHGGRAVAGAWMTAFGDTVSGRLTGWVGQKGPVHPAMACHWGAIQWAKENGYRYYDLGGFDRRYAELLVAGQPLPEEFHQAPSAFKHYMGAEPLLLPMARQRAFDPLTSFIAHAVYPHVNRSQSLRRLIDRLRNG
jgi:lipid II:glycine glycyltransferase (peptidoglycan interpeptide bridge formation enzyme)